MSDISNFVPIFPLKNCKEFMADSLSASVQLSDKKFPNHKNISIDRHLVFVNTF